MNYAEMVADQEQPEIMPNVLSHHLAALTGQSHYQAHQALFASNPAVILTATGPVLSIEDLQAALSAFSIELLRELL